MRERGIYIYIHTHSHRERDTHTYMHTERECGKGRELRGSIVMQTSSINIWQRGLLKQGSEWYRQEYIKVFEKW